MRKNAKDTGGKKERMKERKKERKENEEKCRRSRKK